MPFYTMQQGGVTQAFEGPMITPFYSKRSTSQRGGVMQAFEGPIMSPIYARSNRYDLSQKGAGIGDLFGRFFRWVVPMVKNTAMPLVKSAGSTIAKEALSTIGNIANRTAAGENFKQAAQEGLENAVGNLKRKAEATADLIKNSAMVPVDEKNNPVKSIKGEGFKKNKSIFFMKKKNRRSKKFKDIFQ